MPRGMLILSLLTVSVTLCSCGADDAAIGTETPTKLAAPDPSPTKAIQVLVEPVGDGQVTGVGFRAKVLKNAIRWNLAGTAVNNSSDTPPTMTFVLQGDSPSVDAALMIINNGPPDIRPGSFKLTPKDIPVDNNLTTFEVHNWTSLTRDITNPYNLFYFVDPRSTAPLPDDNGVKVCYRQILYYCVTDPADRAKIDKPKSKGKDD